MNYKKLLLSLFLFTLLVFAQNIRTQSMLAPGDPDPTFGTNGRVLTANRASNYHWYGDTAVQPDGKIIVLTSGYYSRYSGFYYHFILTRYNSDGTLDSQFGEGGIRYYPIEFYPTENSYAKSVYPQPDGKIIFTGEIAGDFAILRVNPNGDLDNTFGVKGRVKTDFGSLDEISKDWIQGLIFKPDGKLLAYGNSEFEPARNPCTFMTPCNANNYMPPRRLAIAQYNADGSLDTSFGDNGLQKTRFANHRDTPTNVFLQPDGKILLIGNFWWRANMHETNTGVTSDEYTSALIRYNSDGTVDRNFGKSGYFEFKDSSDFYVPLPDGKMLGASHCPSYSCSWSSYSVNTKIVRYNADFTLDTSFVGAMHFLQTGEISGVNLQADGKMIFTTYRLTSSNPQTIIYRFNPDGSPDFSFGTNGAVIFDMDDSNAINSHPLRTIILSDGKILLAGRFYAISGTLDGVGNILMRLTGDGAANRDFKSIFPAR